MTGQPIRFDDGAAYERGMGPWSRLVANVFIEWLEPPRGLRWIDVGCGNGVFTELLVERCAPAELHGIDPSEGQLAFARTRPAARVAQFRAGDAVALPFPDDRFDAAVMALVIFFLREPERGVAEMARVVRSGGTVATYAWDYIGNGAPTSPIVSEIRAMGHTPATPPSLSASRIDVLRNLWTNAGIEAVETREVKVTRTFADFDALWASSLAHPVIAAIVARMNTAEIEQLKERVRARLPGDGAGRITYCARANAIKGRVGK
ncbi:MAG: class I SAM-dependent methyltransferase [Alphaproteobacteria bacterium]